MAYLISNACTRCGACLSECPTGAIIAGLTQYHIDADSCAGHASCARVCPVAAISPMPEARGAYLRELLGEGADRAERGSS
jgi:MinD superfamily P-loop ATPase